MRKYLISAAILTLLAAPYAWADPPEDRGHGEGRGEGHGRPQAEAPPQVNQGPGDRGRGPTPQAAMQAPPNRGQEGRGDQYRGFERNRGPAPQMATQAPPDRGGQNRDQNRDFNRGSRGPASQMAVQAPPGRDQEGRGDENRDNRRMGFDRHDSGRDFGRDRDFGREPDRRAFNDNRRNPDFNREGRTSYRSPGYGGPRHDFSGFRDFHRDFRAARHFQVPYYRRPAGWYPHRWAFGEFLPAAFWVRDYWLIDFADYDLPPPPYGAVWVRVDRDALLIDEDSGEIITVVYDVFY